jgi:hypothetical protein
MTGGCRMNRDAGPDATSPAEEQLLRHLHALREPPPYPGRTLAAMIIKRARWQAAVRPYAQAAGNLIGGMADSARIMAGRSAG